MNTNKITIEDVTEVAGLFTVDFFINDGELESLTITNQQLKHFALATGLNEYVFDYSCGGDHIQLSGSQDIDNFLVENRDEVIKAFLEVNRIEKKFKAISERLSDLIVELKA